MHQSVHCQPNCIWINMKFLIVSFALAAVAAAAPQYVKDTPHAYAAILSQRQELGPDGSYVNEFKTENGINVQEQGFPQPLGPKGEPVIVIKGISEHTAPDGSLISIKYTADADGFHPEGAHLPIPPPIPEAILRSLAYNAAHPGEYNKEGEYEYKPVKPLYLPATSTTYRPNYEVEYPTTPKPYYPPSTFYNRPAYPQRPTYTPTPAPFFPTKTFVPTA